MPSTNVAAADASVVDGLQLAAVTWAAMTNESTTAPAPDATRLDLDIWNEPPWRYGARFTCRRRARRPSHFVQHRLQSSPCRESFQFFFDRPKVDTVVRRCAQGRTRTGGTSGEAFKGGARATREAERGR